MPEPLRIQDYYPPSFHECFGCGPKNADGLRLETFLVEDRVVCDWQPEHRLRGAPAILQGGVMAILMDEVAGAAAYVGYHRAQGVELGGIEAFDYATAQLCVDYLAPTPIGETLSLTAGIPEPDRRKAWVTCEAHSSGVLVAKGRLLFLSITAEQRQPKLPATG